MVLAVTAPDMSSANQAHEKSACPHCGDAVADDVATSPYCCAGCQAVATLLREEGLGRYYALAGGDVRPVGAVPGGRGHAWLDERRSVAEKDAAPGTLCSLQVDVQGIHCAACVWLMNETFRRAGGAAITVNPALGKIAIAYARGRFDLDAWVTSVERFGYQLGPSRKTGSRGTLGLTSLTWRLGISAALAMNVMLFSLSFYFGLSPRDGELHRLFTRLSVALSTAVVAIGGWPFFVAAVRGLRARVLHLDLPIALGIALVYATSLASVLRGHGGELMYFDTLNVFVTLMLLGRFLQQALLERNRNYLLADDGADGIFVRRVRHGALQVVAAPRLRAGDRLLVAPGELVPVDARLEGGVAAISTDWINGEATSRACTAGSAIPAGSFNAGRAAFTVVAETAFADSPLVPLLRQPPARSALVPGGTGRDRVGPWDGIARRWVVGVLTVATAGLAIWLPRDPGRALDVVVALLVVTCPCGIGIALPLAYELMQARLRRAGFYARGADVMDRLVRVQHVAFDKTGTLTLGGLELGDPAALRKLAPPIRDAAYNLACRSSHPVATCLAGALGQVGALFQPEVTVTEAPGDGLSSTDAEGAMWRLGRPGWAAAPAAADTDGGARGTWLTHNGVPVARFTVGEVLRPGAAAEVRALATDGFGLWLVSGDTTARAIDLARAVGIPADHVRATRSPEQKAGDIAAIPGDVLYVGDGANDAPAFGAALVAGTVAIDRPVLPGRSDFFLIGASLAPIRAALRGARQLRRVARSVVTASVSYNVLAVATCLTGHMTPLRAAVAMPLSSLVLIAYTAARLTDRGQRAPQAARRALDVPV